MFLSWRGFSVFESQTFVLVLVIVVIWILVLLRWSSKCLINKHFALPKFLAFQIFILWNIRILEDAFVFERICISIWNLIDSLLDWIILSKHFSDIEWTMRFRIRHHAYRILICGYWTFYSFLILISHW